jgi:hypothetical protein
MEPAMFTSVNYKICDWDSVFGTPSVYELGGSGLEPQGGGIFHTLLDWP